MLEDSFVVAKASFRSSEHCVPLELSRYKVCKPCPTLRKENSCKLTLDGVESKTRPVSKKGNVRSSYVKHKPETDSEVQNQNGKINYEKDAMKKKEPMPMESTQNEIVRVKHARTNVSVPNETYMQTPRGIDINVPVCASCPVPNQKGVKKCVPSWGFSSWR